MFGESESLQFPYFLMSKQVRQRTLWLLFPEPQRTQGLPLTPALFPPGLCTYTQASCPSIWQTAWCAEGLTWLGVEGSVRSCASMHMCALSGVWSWVRAHPCVGSEGESSNRVSLSAED